MTTGAPQCHLVTAVRHHGVCRAVTVTSVDVSNIEHMLPLATFSTDSSVPYPTDSSFATAANSVRWQLGARLPLPAFAFPLPFLPA